MKAILQTTGPILTLTSAKQNGRTLFRDVNPAQFKCAAERLEAADLGQLVDVKGHVRINQVFVKRLPLEAQQGLETNRDLCTSEFYRHQFYAPLLKSASLVKLRQNLLDEGLVPTGYFDS